MRSEGSCVCCFQAEDGIRDYRVTGVQTCALPISGARGLPRHQGLRRCDRCRTVQRPRSEERRVGKSEDLGGRRIIKKKNTRAPYPTKTQDRSALLHAVPPVPPPPL